MIQRFLFRISQNPKLVSRAKAHPEICLSHQKQVPPNRVQTLQYEKQNDVQYPSEMERELGDPWKSVKINEKLLAPGRQNELAYHPMVRSYGQMFNQQDTYALWQSS